MLNEKDIVNNCLQRWGKDEKTKNLLEKTQEWIIPIKNDEHKNIFFTLLNKFNYYSREAIYNIFRNLHKKIEEFDPECENTLFLPLISPEGRLNHSYDMLSCYQIATGLDKMCFPTDIYQVEDSYPLDIINNIVLIDDMTGTGTTIKESIKFMINRFRNVFKNKKIHLVILEGSEEGIESIKKLKDESGYDINIICSNTFKKAFTPDYIFANTEFDEARDIVLSYEKEITNNKKKFLLGYEQSEALMAFYYDTPNNTLSSFWFTNKEKKWTPLFPRNENFGPKWTRDLKRKMRAKNNVNYMLKKTNFEKE